MAKEGVKSVAVINPGFSVDCIETLDEIGREAAHAFHEAGGEKFSHIPCLNDSAGGHGGDRDGGAARAAGLGLNGKAEPTRHPGVVRHPPENFMSRKLDLRTGRPVWFAYRTPKIPTGALTRDIKTDVLIVGMGISGAMMAEALTAGGHDVVCIDRRGPMQGSTPATTALVQFEIDQPLIKLSKMIGRAKAEQAWRRSRLAVQNLGDRIDNLGIDCRPAPRQSLYLAGNVLGPAELREEAGLRRQAGIRADLSVAASRWRKNSASTATARLSATATSRSTRAS